MEELTSALPCGADWLNAAHLLWLRPNPRHPGVAVCWLKDLYDTSGNFPYYWAVLTGDEWNMAQTQSHLQETASYKWTPRENGPGYFHILVVLLYKTTKFVFIKNAIHVCFLKISILMKDFYILVDIILN